MTQPKRVPCNVINGLQRQYATHHCEEDQFKDGIFAWGMDCQLQTFGDDRHVKVNGSLWSFEINLEHAVLWGHAATTVA